MRARVSPNHKRGAHPDNHPSFRHGARGCRRARIHPRDVGRDPGPVLVRHPYLTPVAPGWSAISLLTTGDSVRGGMPMASIPDGLGTLDTPGVSTDGTGWLRPEDFNWDPTNPNLGYSVSGIGLRAAASTGLARHVSAP